MKKLFEWLCINRLSLNISKTNFVIFHAINKIKFPITILINNKAIQEVNYVKYLGVLIDSKLTFKPHIDELSKKISRAIGILQKLRYFVSTKILIMVYYAIVYPFLLYGILVWGSTSKSLLEPLFILQKKFVRLATFNSTHFGTSGPLVHSAPLFYKLNLLNIFDIFKLQLGILVYESMNNIRPVCNIIKFQEVSQTHNYNTRQSSRGDIYRTFARTTRYGLNSLQTAGGVLWSSLPPYLRTSLSKNSFKRNLKVKLVSLYQLNEDSTC